MSLLESRAREGKKLLAIVAAAVVILLVYMQFQSKAVELPPAELQALREAAPAEHFDNAQIEARKTSQGYVVDLIHEEAGGRRLVYKYEVSPELTVTNLGLTVGLMGKNPMTILVPLLLAIAFFGYVVFRVVVSLVSKRCPHCRTILTKDELTLFGGEIGVTGDSLAPIVLTTHSCSECGFKRKQVGLPGEFRAGSTNVATLVRPDLSDDLEKRQEQFMKSRKLTYKDWEEMLSKFKEEYDGEERP